MKKMMYAGVALVAIVVILVMAGIAISNNNATTNNVAPQNGPLLTCEQAVKEEPLNFVNQNGYYVVNPEYEKWVKDYGNCKHGISGLI
jgi:hypothetical protein